jgi:MFS transporter, DHA2 family, multidrug resistance protein
MPDTAATLPKQEAARPRDSADAAWQPKYNRWIIALTVTLATFMEVLDTSIANVSLPHIAGSLGASQEESTWVLTSYLVSNAIILPISAWLSRLIGRKRFYMTCVALFTASSFLCGLAPSLAALVFFRVLQGVGGGGLQPSEQAILADTFPPSMRGMAFAVYGMAVVVAPAIGPTLGGWITDNYTWHWVFYINVPVGIISLLLTNKLVEDPPYLTEQRKRFRKGRVDWWGLGLIAVGISCLQLVLDKGQEKDWFSTHWITVTFIVGIVCLVVWIVWEWRHPDPIVDVRLFKHRNFAVAIFFTFTLGVVLFGTTVMLPQFLQNLLGYPAVTAGEALAGGGFIMMVMMPLAGALAGRIDPRLLMAIGFSSTGAALFFMSQNISLGMDFRTAFLLRILQTAGLAFIFIPSSTLSYVGIPVEKNNQVSAINSFVRNIGGSLGIALIVNFLTRSAQQHQTTLVAHAVPGAAAYESTLNGMAATLRHSGLNTFDARQQSIGRLYGMIQQQATSLAYVDAIAILALVIGGLTPFVLILRRPKKRAGSGAALH